MNFPAKIISKLGQISQLTWRVSQPLTKRPSDSTAVVSDLFIWRKGHGWSTFFELTDIASLFCETSQPAVTRIIIFDQFGSFVEEAQFEAPRYSRTQINVSKLAASCQGTFGTFCVLHPKTPDVVSSIGSNLTERGYVSYCFGESSLKSYVHGNLDALGLSPTGAIELLAGASFRKREYHLQHDLQSNKAYDLAIVNASTRPQAIQLECFNVAAKLKCLNNSVRVTYSRPESKYRLFRASLGSGACHLFHLDPCEAVGDSVRVVIKSNLVMLRPIVFQLETSRIDVFHG